MIPTVSTGYLLTSNSVPFVFCARSGQTNKKGTKKNIPKKLTSFITSLVLSLTMAKAKTIINKACKDELLKLSIISLLFNPRTGEGGRGKGGGGVKLWHVSSLASFLTTIKF